jgi:hypothetical protein
MYGMINQAIEKLVVEQHGPAVWKRICAEAEVTDRDFVSLQSYPDEVTYRLVGAASRVLEAPPEAILEAFGESWTDYAKTTSFARLMQFAGRTFPEFVASLDQMHAKIKFSLPELEPPSFRVSELTDRSFRLHYYSRRAGLAPLVKGMLRGVGRIYAVEVDIRLDRPRGDGQDHDEFVVAYAPAAAAAASKAAD